MKQCRAASGALVSASRTADKHHVALHLDPVLLLLGHDKQGRAAAGASVSASFIRHRLAFNIDPVRLLLGHDTVMKQGRAAAGASVSASSTAEEQHVALGLDRVRFLSDDTA